MKLTHLPSEILLTVASYLPHTSNFYALIRTSRDLYASLSWFLYHFESRYNHAKALYFAVNRNRPHQVQALLDGLRFTRAKPHPDAQSMPCHQFHGELGIYLPVTPSDSGIPYRPNLPSNYLNDSNHSNKVPCKCFYHSELFWNSVLDHPLYQKNYTIRSIFNIQRCLILAIRRKHPKIVKLLLDHGAQTNFHLGPNFLLVLPTVTRKWWVWKELELPPLCVAVQSKDLQLVKLLLKHEANSQVQRPSPLHLFVEKKLKEIAFLLEELRVEPQEKVLLDSTLLKLQRARSAWRDLIAQGHDIESYGSMALYSAQIDFYLHLVDQLKSRGATLAELFDV
jgi:hypothetical protein